MPLIDVTLTDAEWRVRCEELAEMELKRKRQRENLDEEADEWKERKKTLDLKIEKLTERIELVAQEVSTRSTKRDAQTELPLQGTEGQTPEGPTPASPEDVSLAEAQPSEEAAAASEPSA